jgi:hypothetical protein
MKQDQTRSSAVEVESRYDERQTALAPYLDRLAAPEEGHPSLHPAISLEPWELSVLEDALNGNDTDGDRWPILLAESVAFQQKSLSENDELEREEFTSPESLLKRAEQLTVNAAIGLALMEDIQRVIDETILAGDMGEAKRLTGSRNKLAQVVKAIKDRLSPEDCQEAESMHQEMLTPGKEQNSTDAGPAASIDVDPDEANQPPHNRLEEPDEGPPKQIKLNRSARLPLGHAAEERQDYSTRLLMVLGVAVLAWTILILPRFFKEPLPVLTMPDLPQSAAIQKINALPPSLYVYVSREGWRSMSREQRSQWIEELGKTAAAAGYTGVNVRTSGGDTVAQWLKQTGARLLTSSGPGS